MVAFAAPSVVLVFERTVAFYSRVPLSGLQLVAKGQAYGQAAEEESSNHLVDRRSYERCSGLIVKACCWSTEDAPTSNAVLFVSHRSPYETPKLYHHSLPTTCRNARNATDTMYTTSSVDVVKPTRSEG
jgi:hypothetical protein